MGVTKRGVEQRVLLSHSRVVRWLLRYLAHFGDKDLDKPFAATSYYQVAAWLRRACAALGFGAIHWTVHGLRRGGATQLFIANMAFADIMIAGRWMSERSCREYIRRGEVGILRLRADLPPNAWTRCRRLAVLGEKSWDYQI